VPASGPSSGEASGEAEYIARDFSPVKLSTQDPFWIEDVLEALRDQRDVHITYDDEGHTFSIIEYDPRWPVVRKRLARFGLV
jgi:hypothetical protein